MNFYPKAEKSHSSAGLLTATPTRNEYKGMRILNFTCQCCGFRAVPSKEVPSGGMEFVTINGKLFLLCLMCAQSQMLSRPVTLKNGKLEYNHGCLVYCPEIPQGKIIEKVRDIYALAMHQSANPNRQLLAYIEELKQSYIDLLVKRVSNIPALKVESNYMGGYVSLYKFAPPELLEKGHKVFGGIRYIPNDLVFSHIIQYWLDTSYSSLANKI
ncbi:hypothetical protein [Pseudoalteromonas sp. MEBiC 03485]|uniref:hypothetical protein n=1 Tax=Pseudoalteromonas sp. MEBiC 03485 TaxID=2571103 RepID=UPI001020A10E|nr:hypothetical protein [Pseudoalteromonas sp. MEBiC 03485]RZD19627.1 hypothetical protein EVU92_20720 [Pseudoalteromonas sp. MEBiC 03485]